MYQHAMTALATAAASVLLAAGPATAEESVPCAQVDSAVPKSGAVAAPGDGVETRRFVEQLVQVLKPGPAEEGRAPAPTLDGEGARALLDRLACQTGEEEPGTGVAVELPDTGEQTCVTYAIGPGWAPDWPLLDALGIRQLVEQSSGVASVCVAGDAATPPAGDAATPPAGDAATPPAGDAGTPPAGAPSTTAVEPPLSQPQPQTQPHLERPQPRPRIVAEQQTNVTSTVRTDSRVNIPPQLRPYASTQINVQTNGRPALQAAGVIELLRELAGR